MVVHNFNAVSVSAAPHKADTPLVVDTYAVLPAPVTAERLQPIRGRSLQIFEFGSGLNHSQFSARYSLDIAEPSAVMAEADLFGFLAAKRLYHRLLYRTSCHVKQYNARMCRAGCRVRGQFGPRLRWPGRKRQNPVVAEMCVDKDFQPSDSPEGYAYAY
jgi:hypothetical protein